MSFFLFILLLIPLVFIILPAMLGIRIPKIPKTSIIGIIIVVVVGFVAMNNMVAVIQTSNTTVDPVLASILDLKPTPAPAPSVAPNFADNMNGSYLDDKKFKDDYLKWKGG